jgi:hypothetical protein
MRHACSAHQVRPVQMSRTAFSLIPYSRARTIAETRFLALLGELLCESDGRDRRNISTASSLVRIARLFNLFRPVLPGRDLLANPLVSDAARSQVRSSTAILGDQQKTDAGRLTVFEINLFGNHHGILGEMCTATCALHDTVDYLTQISGVISSVLELFVPDMCVGKVRCKETRSLFRYMYR